MSGKQWTLYILECGVDKAYYTGITTDLPRRLFMHLTKRGSKYTISRWPYIKYVFSVTCRDESEARKLECRVKKLSRQQKEEFMRMEGKVWEQLPPCPVRMITTRPTATFL